MKQESMKKVADTLAIVNQIKAHLETAENASDGWFMDLALMFKRLDDTIDVQEAIKVAKIHELLDKIKSGDVEINVIVVGPSGDAKVETKKETLQ